MVVFVNRMLIPKRFGGWVLWPFIVLKDAKYKEDTVFMNHERIHLRQQAELLVLPFFVWYGIEFVVRLIQYRKSLEAYRNISFEREAYENEKDLDYLKKRPFFKMVKFL